MKTTARLYLLLCATGLCLACGQPVVKGAETVGQSKTASTPVATANTKATGVMNNPLYHRD